MSDLDPIFGNHPPLFSGLNVHEQAQLIELINERVFPLEPYLRNNQFDALVEGTGEVAFQTDFAQRVRNKISQWTSLGFFYKPEKREWRKYSLVDFVWLEIIERLRSFGYPNVALTTLYENLMSPAASLESLRDLALEVTEKYPQKTGQKGEDGLVIEQWFPDITFGHRAWEAFMCGMAGVEKDLPNTLSVHVSEIVLERKDKFLIVFANGHAECVSLVDEMDQVIEDSWLIQPHISIYLPDLLNGYIEGEMIDHETFRSSLISDEEYDVIRELRKGGLTSLNIRFNKNDEIDLIESTKDYNPKDVERKYLNHILSTGGYETITIHTQNGKTVSFKKTTKVKPK